MFLLKNQTKIHPIVGFSFRAVSPKSTKLYIKICKVKTMKEGRFRTNDSKPIIGIIVMPKIRNVSNAISKDRLGKPR